ncbi:MAG: SipW-dependent-type signal peptide-containing protein, partial [Bifidobacteriaceae bacterium]|nr:SipW-dependent-type signal peptide-containing protein [Bifidobacteriaceae bacterium]
MTINPQTDRERRSRRFKGLVAGAAGVALLLGGSTFAYWSDSTQETVGTITNGVLSV